MLEYGQFRHSFMPQQHPPREFIEYSISSSNELEVGRNKNPIFVGRDIISKKKTNKKITIYDISSILSANEEDTSSNFSSLKFLIQKEEMPPQEILNIFSDGVDIILDIQAENKSEDQSPKDPQSLRELSIRLATRANNSSSTSLLPINSSKQNSNIKLIYDSYYMISHKLKLFIVECFLKNDLSNFESVSDLGQIYNNCQSKVNSINKSFSPLCLPKLHLNADFEDIFKQTIFDVFDGKKTINNCESHFEFIENENSDPKVSDSFNSNSFGFDNSNGLDHFLNPFGGFTSGCNSNDFNDAARMFESMKESKNCPKLEESESTQSTIIVDFDGIELFERISTLIIQYFLENVILKKSPDSSAIQNLGDKSDEAELTEFYYNINSSEKKATENDEEEKSDSENSIVHDTDFINSFQFIKKTGDLYESKFMPNLIDSIIEYYTPIVTQFFEKCEIGESKKNLTVYFNEIQQIECELNNNLESVSFILPRHSIEQIIVAFRQLVFASKLDDICKSGLRLLVQKKDIKTIELCADYAKSTNKIQNFAHELSFDLESVVGDCYKAKILDENVESNPIRDSIDYMKMLNELCTSSFNNTRMRLMLERAFKKGLNVISDQVARLLAEEVNYQFLHLPTYTAKPKKEGDETEESKDADEDKEQGENEGQNKRFKNLTIIKDLINVFKYLTCKDVFEAYYHLYLSRRVFMLKASVIETDEYFAHQLRIICGPEYTKRIDTIFKDLHDSSRFLSEFQEEETRKGEQPPGYFKALVLNQSSWITNVDDIHRTPIETPIGVREVLSNFAQFFLQKNPKKQFEWNHHLSRVKLSVQNSSSGIVKEIQCNGIAATILSLFNNHQNLTKKEIIDLCKGSEKIIDECIKVLKSKKNGKLLKTVKMPSKSGYVVDLESSYASEVTSSTGIVKMPFIKMILPRSQTENAIMHVDSSRAQVIDANVMKVLKRDHTMDKNQLKEIIKDMIQFRLDDELFENELQNLAKKLYLRLDQSGRVHYLP